MAAMGREQVWIMEAEHTYALPMPAELAELARLHAAPSHKRLRPATKARRRRECIS